MGCGVSRPETDEGGREGRDLKIITRRRSIGKDSETADSFISDKELLEISSTDSKNSKTNGEKKSKEDENECKDEEEKGDELKISPEPPSFRIYCVFPPDHPNDHDHNDDLQRNKHISDENKEHKGKRQAAVGTKIRRRFNNVKKRLKPPTVPSCTATRA